MNLNDPQLQLAAIEAEFRKLNLLYDYSQNVAVNVARQLAAVRDAITRLEGHPNSKLDGENGLAAATMRLLKHYGAQCEKE